VSVARSALRSSRMMMSLPGIRALPRSSSASSIARARGVNSRRNPRNFSPVWPLIAIARAPNRFRVWFSDSRARLKNSLIMRENQVRTRRPAGPVGGSRVNGSRCQGAMREILFAYEPAIRLTAFVGIFIIMAAFDLLVPRRKQAVGRGWRWPNNLGVVVVDTILVRILRPTTAVGLAVFAAARGFGLFNVIALPPWVGVIASVVILDLAIYLQHVLFHA